MLNSILSDTFHRFLVKIRQLFSLGKMLTLFYLDFAGAVGLQSDFLFSGILLDLLRLLPNLRQTTGDILLFGPLFGRTARRFFWGTIGRLFLIFVYVLSLLIRFSGGYNSFRRFPLSPIPILQAQRLPSALFPSQCL